MQAKELREKSTEELMNELVETRKEQFVMRMQKNAGQLENASQVKVARRKIARIKTVLNEQQQSSEQ